MGAHAADVILPATTYAEKSGTYVNTEGRVQMAQRAGFARSGKRSWVFAYIPRLWVKTALNGSNLRTALYDAYPHMAVIDGIAEADAEAVSEMAKLGGRTRAGALISPVADFYMTNPIARASAVMAECSKLARGEMLEAAE